MVEAILCFLSGSPPPMRGKALEKNKAGLKKRITPAYAGKSLVVVGICDNKQDHPRLCGEKVRP